MHQRLPRHAICVFLTILLISTLPSLSAAQPMPVDPPDEPPYSPFPCPHRFATSSQVNGEPQCPNWGEACGGVYSSTWVSDNLFQCLEERKDPTCLPKPFLEWIWTFDNVPAGTRYLTFEGFTAGNPFQFFFQPNDASEPCRVHQYQPIDGAVVDASTNRPGGITVLIGPSPRAGKVCLLLRTKGTPDATKDRVEIDFLRITTDPTNPCQSNEF